MDEPKFTIPMRYAICYVSTATPGLKIEEIQEILNNTEKNNNKKNITGVLLYSEGNFLQVLEGEKETLNELYTTIKDDNRHRNLIKILQKEIEENQFDSYICNFSAMDTSNKSTEVEAYLTHVENLHPSVRNSVNYLLKRFTEA